MGGRSKTPSTSVNSNKTSAPNVRAHKAAKESLAYIGKFEAAVDNVATVQKQEFDEKHKRACKLHIKFEKQVTENEETAKEHEKSGRETKFC